MSVETAVLPEPATIVSEGPSGLFGNRFLLVAVAAQRVLQIRAGARPRVDPGTHKAGAVAVAEVLAGYVPYFAS